MNIELIIEYINKEIYFRDIYLFIERIKNIIIVKNIIIGKNINIVRENL